MSYSFHFIWNGVEVPVSAFDNSLRDQVAYRIGTTAGVLCRDKAAALELLRYEADALIEKIRAEPPPR